MLGAPRGLCDALRALRRGRGVVWWYEHADAINIGRAPELSAHFCFSGLVDGTVLSPHLRRFVVSRAGTVLSPIFDGALSTPGHQSQGTCPRLTLRVNASYSAHA